jgi:hypothetical protein
MNMPLALLNRRRRGGGFSPNALFALAEPGVWFDPSDVANLNWRRNLLTWTEQFDNASWTKNRGSVAANVETATDGSLTADRYTGDGTSGSKYVLSGAISAGVYTGSVYLKAGTNNFAQLLFIGDTTSFVNFDISAGTVGTSGGTATGSIVSVGNGWYRCIAVNTSSATTGFGVAVTGSSSDGRIAANTLATSILIWGAQLELGSVATDYQRITDVNTEVIERFPTATLYQDTAGTTPVTTTGQSVGLMLDKSKGLVLGPELVTNGGFDSATGWTVSAQCSIGSGVANIISTDGSFQSVVQNRTLTGGSTYELSFDVVSYTSGTPRFTFTGASVDISFATGTGRRVARFFVPTTVTSGITFTRLAGVTNYSIDNISVKELPGNHAVQATTANRPIYGVHPFGGRRNLLTWSEDLTNAVWGKTRTTVSGTKVSADSTADTSHSINFSGLTYSGVQSTVSFDASAAEITLLFVQMGSGAIAGFNLSAGALTSYSLGAPTATITSLGSGLYRCTMTATPNSNNLIFFLGEGDGSTLDVTLAGTRTGQGLNLNRVQLETGSTATAYQRVTDQYNVTEAGVSSVSYLFFDGVNDSLATSTITPGVDKAQVFAGVRKLSDAAQGIFAELSTSTSSFDGTFRLTFPGGAGVASYAFLSKGTLSSSISSGGFASPTTNVVTATSDISGDLTRLRVNGTQTGQDTADQGTGNYLAYPLYIGARAGTSLFFSGHLYSLIARFGPNLAAGQISSTETWVASRTGITI